MNLNLFIKGILHVLFKRKMQIVTFFIATLLVVVPLALLSAESTYQSTAQVRLEQGREFVSDLRLDTLGAVQAPVIRFNQEEQLNFAISIITGRSLAERVVDTLGATVLFPDLGRPGLLDKLLSRKPPSANALKLAAVERLQDQLDATALSKSSLINISYRHDDPETAAVVVNSLVQLYIDRHLGIRKNTRSDEFFQQQFGANKAVLAEAEQKLRDFKRTLNISTSIDEERTLLISQINRMRNDYNEAVSKQVETENRVEQLKIQLANTARDPAGIGMLREKLLELQLKESEMALNYNSESRTLDNLRNEIAAIKSRLKELGGNKRYGSSASKEGSLFGALQSDLLKAETDLSALTARQTVVGDQLQTLRQRLAQLDAAENRFAVLDQQVNAARSNNNLYLTKFEEQRISNAMDAEKISSISLIEPARPPLQPIPSKLPLLLALGLFVGVVGGLGLAFFLELLNRTFDRREEVEHDLGLPVLGSIPDYSPKPG